MFLSPFLLGLLRPWRRVMVRIWKMALLGLGVLGFGAGWALAAEPPPVAPQVLAVKMYADWCPGCQAMAGAWKQTQERLADQPVLFVKLDKTTPDLAKQSAMLAERLGLALLYSDHPGTGFVLLVDPQSHALLDTLNPMMNADQMVRRIQAHTGLSETGAMGAKHSAM